MTPQAPDQRELWITSYGQEKFFRHQVSAFANACIPLLAPSSAVLELGCGGGMDSEAFAKAGHNVVATDFVPGIISTNRGRYAHLANLTFEEMRIDDRLRFPDDTFDAAYAHLSLHYFIHDITVDIFAEIRRVLKPGGWLMFACKSPQDPSWGKGIELEPGMFDFHGKVRHFFSEAYARQLMADEFTDIQIESHTGKLYRQPSAWITAIARAR